MSLPPATNLNRDPPLILPLANDGSELLLLLFVLYSLLSIILKYLGGRFQA